jgi:hypothetical protein
MFPWASMIFKKEAQNGLMLPTAHVFFFFFSAGEEIDI